MRDFPPCDTERLSDDGPSVMDFESNATSPADVESAGRSCMVILALIVAIVILIGIWIAFHAISG